MKKLFVIAMLMLMVGCSAFENQISKLGNAATSGDYIVTVWSGGEAVVAYHVNNSFINTEQNSDGYFFFVNGKLCRVTGTVTIEEQ